MWLTKKTSFIWNYIFRDVGAGYGIDFALRDAVNEGLIQGPQFLAAGDVTMTGGHGWFIGRKQMV